MNILILTDKSYPYGSAYSSRVRHFALAFHEMGYAITMISANLDVEEAKAFGMNNIEYISMKYPQNRITQLGIGVARKYKTVLEDCFSRKKYDAVFVNSITYALPTICEVCKKYGARVFVEKCEWYDKSSFILGGLNPYYREYIREIDSVKPDGYIVISPLFDEYYTKKNFKTFLIPTILDVENINAIYHTKRNKISIAFSGSLGNGKEKMRPMAIALETMGDEKNNFLFDFYGPSEKELRENINDDKLYQRVSSCFRINGRIPQKDVYPKIANADFTFFLREKRKSSDAGFPTKLAESMSVGTPVIANSTGSINHYLHNEENGFLLQNLSVESIVGVLNSIKNLSEEDYLVMRKNARFTAEQYFDYRKYLKGLTLFLTEGKNGKF